jgi:hypothetical protein
VAGALLLEDRLRIVYTLEPEKAGLPICQLQFELFDVEECLRPGGHLARRDDAKEAEIRRLAEPYLGRAAEAMGKESS